MLNKLLKRCMPWMDKGRWETIFINKIDGQFVVDMEKSSPDLAHAFEGVRLMDENEILAFVFTSTEGIGYRVKDFRFSSLKPFIYTNSDYVSNCFKNGNIVTSVVGSHVLYAFARESTPMQLDLFVERVIL